MIENNCILNYEIVYFEYIETVLISINKNRRSGRMGCEEVMESINNLLGQIGIIKEQLNNIEDRANEIKNEIIKQGGQQWVEK